jgi:hypothetical protein
VLYAGRNSCSHSCKIQSSQSTDKLKSPAFVQMLLSAEELVVVATRRVVETLEECAVVVVKMARSSVEKQARKDWEDLYMKKKERWGMKTPRQRELEALKTKVVQCRMRRVKVRVWRAAAVAFEKKK